jgi:hypothetical protein
MDLRKSLGFLLMLFLSQALAAQITINIGRSGADVTATIETDGTISVEGPFGWDVWKGSVPDWIVPDDIQEEFDVGNDDLVVPGAGNAQLVVEVVGGLVEVYTDYIYDKAVEAAGQVLEGLKKLFS